MTKTLNYSAAVTAIVALVLSMFAAMPTSAFACEYEHCGGNDGNDNSVNILVVNSGLVVSNTTATASTGGNWAGGSEGGDGDDGGDGGDGGDASNECGCEDPMGGDGGAGGNGGNGGAGGEGGLIETGDADAAAGSANAVNSTDIEVEAADCGCDDEVGGWYDEHGRFHQFSQDENDNSVNLAVINEGGVLSNTEAKAKTGHNDAEGSVGGEGDDGGDGGNGGDANGSYAFGGYAGDGGEGGNGGDGGLGGTIRTGRAVSTSGSINVVNTTLIRVTR